jgi:hypothetical protein
MVPDRRKPFRRLEKPTAPYDKKGLAPGRFICFFIVNQINHNTVTVTEGFMLVGRLVGWLFLGVSFLMASADAVLALGPGEHSGIATRDVWILLAGRAWEPASPSFASLMMAWPAWTAIAPLGLMLLWSCRQRRRRVRAGRRFVD